MVRVLESRSVLTNAGTDVKPLTLKDDDLAHRRSNSICFRPNSMTCRFLFVGFEIDSSFILNSLYSVNAWKM